VRAPIGRAGRLALELAWERTRRARPTGRGVATYRVDERPLPLVQMAAEGEQGPSAEGGESATPPPALAAAQTVEREMRTPSAEEVADRVYRLLLDTLRLERERGVR